MWVTESTTNENGYCWLTYDRVLKRIEGYLGNHSIEYLLTTNLSFKATCEQTLCAKVCTFKPCMLALGWWICCDGGFRIHQDSSKVITVLQYVLAESLSWPRPCSLSARLLFWSWNFTQIIFHFCPALFHISNFCPFFIPFSLLSYAVSSERFPPGHTLCTVGDTEARPLQNTNVHWSAADITFQSQG